MKKEKLEEVEVEESPKVTVEEVNDWITVSSEILKRITPLVRDAYRTLKNIESYLKNFKK